MTFTGKTGTDTTSATNHFICCSGCGVYYRANEIHTCVQTLTHQIFDYETKQLLKRIADALEKLAERA